LKIIIL